MVQKLIKASLVLFSLLAGAVISIAILLWVYEDEFGEKIIRQLRESSSAEITLEDQEFSFWRSLPYVSYDLKKVEVKDENSKSILKADVLGLRLSLKSVFQKKLKLENILIQDGILNIVINQSGKANYDIFSSEAIKEERYFKSMELDYTQFKRVKIHVTDHKNQWATQVFFKDALLNFSQNDIETKVDLEGVGLVESYHDSGNEIISKLPFDLSLAAENILSQNKWIFSSDHLMLYGDNYMLKGEYGMKHPKLIDIELKTELGRFQNILKAFQLSIIVDNHFVIKGNYDLNLRYKGESTRKNGPEFRMTSHISGAYLENDFMQDPLEDIELDIQIGKNKNEDWEDLLTELTNFNVTSTDLHFTSNFKIKGIQNPIFEFGGKGTLSLPAVIGLFSTTGIEATRGSVTVKGLQGIGSYKEGALQLEKLQGKILVEHGKLEINDQEINIPKAILGMSKQQVTIEQTALELNGRPVLLSATIPNFSQNLRNDRLIINTDLSFDKLDYEELVQLMRGERDHYNQEIIEEATEEKSLDYIVNMTAKLKEFSYHKNAFKDCSFLFAIDRKNIDFKIEALAYRGKLKAIGQYLMNKEASLELSLETQAVQISELLKNFDNFDQKVIRDKNIKGGMNSKNVIRLFWDEEGNYLNDDLQVYSDITILDGELLGVTMLYNFSKYIKLRDLMEIKFTKMHNYLEISARKIYVPQMFIQSNAMNMTMAGEHSFDNDINYSFKFNAGQLLLNKLKKYAGNKKPLPAKKDGMFNMYFNLAGTVDEYQVENSRKLVHRHFSESTAHKYIIYEELKRAFPDITNPIYEPEEWLDFSSKFTSERESAFPKNRQQNKADRVMQEEEFLDNF